MTALWDTYGPYGTVRTGIPDGTILDCGDPVPHQYRPRPGVILVDRSTWVCVCGKPYGVDHGIGTGYAGTSDHRMICYRHAEEAEAADFAAATDYACYVTPVPVGPAEEGRVTWGNARRPGDPRHYQVTTWTGRELARVVSYSDSHAHPSGGVMRAIRAVGFDGSRWYGRYMPDWSELVTLHRAKGAAR